MAYFNGKPILFSPQINITGNDDAAFWDGFTAGSNGNPRANYSSAFLNWGNEYIRPTKKITPTDVNSGNQTFSGCVNLQAVEKAYFDFQNKPRGANNQQGWYLTFSGCPNLTTIEDIGMQAEFEYRNTFAYCQQLKTIEVIRTDKGTKWSSGCFNNCKALENVTIAGTIAQNSFDIHYSTKLTKASIISILEACNEPVTDVTITLPLYCIDGKTLTESLFTSDYDVSAAWSNARSNGYTIVCDE